MKLYIILACLTAMISVAQSTFVVAVTGLSTATTASLASGAALVLGAKLLALKGVLIGRALRGKRETLEDIFLEASKKDQYDCAKMLVCELNAKSVLEVGLCLQSSFLIFQISKPSLKPVSVEKQECYAASIFSSKFHFFYRKMKE